MVIFNSYVKLPEGRHIDTYSILVLKPIETNLWWLGDPPFKETSTNVVF